MADLSGRRVGEYLLRSRIGDGGHGDVYRAEHRVLRRVAVVKVMNEQRQCADNAEARFLREAQLASQLRHPNAAHVYDFGVADGDDEDGLMWIAMEFIDGVTLEDWLAAHGPMSVAEAVRFFEPLAEVVDAAHQLGIVHRDLKPSNVMVVQSKALGSEGAPVPMLIDFGIAKGKPARLVEDDEPIVIPPNDDKSTDLVRAAPAPGRREPTKRIPPHLSGLNLVRTHERRITPNGCAFGSRGYMSPEQWCDASSVGPAADIYSLGVMLYEALTGRLPFQATSTNDLFLKQRFSLPDLTFSPEVDRILYRALATEPEHRHANALEFAKELQALLEADPNEQIRSLTRRWNERGKSSDMLARGATLAELKRSVQSPRVAANLSLLDDSFIRLSLRRARRARWGIGALVALVVMSLLAVRAEVRARMAEQFAMESEVEQGRQELLHGESSAAVSHLAHAYQGGERSSGVAFMLARGLQPRVAELARLTSDAGRMWSATFAPDGKWVLTTDDASAKMWDAASGQLLFTMRHGDTVYRAVFSEDGSQIITAGGDGTVRIWRAATGAPIRELAHRGPHEKRWRYSAVAVSSNLVAAMDMLGKDAHVWNAETGAVLAELRDFGDAAFEKTALAFSADARWLVASGGHAVHIFDTTTWRRVGTIAGPRVRSLSLDPTGSRVAVVTYEGVASIWEIPSGALVRRLRNGGPSVEAVAYSRDGALLATASLDGTEQIWDAASGALRTQFNTHRGKIYAIEFSRTGDRVLSAGADGAVVVSKVATGMPVARLEGPTRLILAAHFDTDARRVVGASWDGTARVWDAASPYLRWESPPVGPECDTEESLVPDQRFIALSCREHGTRVWDTARGELVARLPEVTSSALPALTASGDRAAIARGKTVEIYALPSGYLLRTIAHSAAVSAVGFAPVGHDLVSGAVDGSLLLTRDGGESVALPASSAEVDAATILADGRVVFADASRRLQVIASDLSKLMDLAAPTRVRLLRPTPDGSRLVTISTTREQAPPALWDLDQYQLVAPLDGHTGRVFTARFVTAGGEREFLTAGTDGTVRRWDAATGRPRQVYRGDSHFLVDAALAPDGTVVVAGGSDGFLRFWDASNGRLLWMLQAHMSFVIGVHYEGTELVTRGFAGDVARWLIPSPSKIIEACSASACTSGATTGR